MFMSDNPSFSIGKFINACYPEETKTK